MGLKPGDLEAETPSGLGDWYANLIYIDRRKCVLFANKQTLLNFLIPDLSRAQIRKLADLFRHHFQQLLVREGLDKKEKNQIIEAYSDIQFTKYNSRSVLGSLTDLAFNYKFHLMNKGGLQGCNLPEIIKRLNRVPMSALEYQLPIDAFLDHI